MRPLSHSLLPSLFALSLLLLPLALRGQGTFTFTVLDIPDIQRGAGLAVVMQTPSGKTFLYDTGSGYPVQLSSDGWSGNFNAGRDLIAPFLKKAGIEKIDGVLVSHAHYDHFGGLLWLDEHFRPAKLIDPGFTYQGESDNAYLTEVTDYDKLRAKYIERGTYQAANTGDLLELDKDLRVEVIAPPKTFFPDHQAETRAKNDSPAHYLLNANSLGIRIQHGDIVFYLPGDIQTEDIDLSLLPSIDHAKIKCHVLVAPGHGIHCTPAFAEATRPEVSIASVFERYAKGLKSTPMLKAVGAKTYITGLDGNIGIVSDGKRYTVEASKRKPLTKPAEAADFPPSTVKKSIPYVSDGHERHVLDVYAPEGAKDLPVVFWIHGGGWEAGDKSSVQEKPRYFTERGCVFVSTNYRLLPEVDMGTLIRDVAKSLDWVSRHIVEHGGDPSRLYVMGHSAGAQLAAILCTDGRYLEEEGIAFSSLKGCVPVDGDTFDIPAIIETDATRRRVHGFPPATNGHWVKFGGDPAKHVDFSAVTHVAKGKGIPPFLILHVAEHPDTSAQAKRFAEVLKRHDVPVTVFGGKETSHRRLSYEIGVTGDPATEALAKFLEETGLR